MSVGAEATRLATEIVVAQLRGDEALVHELAKHPLTGIGLLGLACASVKELATCAGTSVPELLDILLLAAERQVFREERDGD